MTRRADGVERRTCRYPLERKGDGMQRTFEQRTRSHRQRPRDEAEADTAPAAKHEDLARDLDDLLDEIDSVLEENAEEFVAGYVQKGGE
jgi:ubiquitin-like protein Pup